MRKLAFVTVAFSSLAAWAQGADKDAKKAPEAAARPPEMGKPAPELKQEYGGMIGSWKCTGKMTMGGKELQTTGIYKFSWDLDNNVVVGRFEGKAPGMPGAHKGLDIYGYDAVSKMFYSFGADNLGGYAMSRTKGWQGDSEEWSGSGSMMGQESEQKYTVTRKGDKEVSLKGGMGADSWETHCSRK